ncbi:RluA family pseudouridine synthase [Candidatus Saccharibacteria bacterium]|nr:RluA family pseudouridine synthase [Candidatus Saccharibacteria bacterium]
MKFDSSDLVAILRMFHEVQDDVMPRHIERISKSKPHEKNVLIRFAVGKKNYAVLIDGAAEDDEDYVYEMALESGKEHFYVLLPLPQHTSLTTYALPYRAKEVYLLRDEPQSARLDLALVERFGGESRSTYQKRISRGEVLINGEVELSSKRAVKDSDVITIQSVETAIEATEVEVIYEDDNVVVINKPVGLLTHAKGALAEEYTAADFVKDKTSYKADTNRPGIIHRLDRDTSGVLLMVKNDEAASMISKQFTNRTTKKTYAAVVSGTPEQEKAKIDLPIGRNPSAPSTFRVDASGKTAETVYEVEEVGDTHTLVTLKPRTGRTHQLRVHMAYIGTPILGDKVYGKESADRMYLHAHKLEITLPGGIRKVFEAPVPASFHEVI